MFVSTHTVILSILVEYLLIYLYVLMHNSSLFGQFVTLQESFVNLAQCLVITIFVTSCQDHT
jgi:hypothetical protein